MMWVQFTDFYEVEQYLFYVHRKFGFLYSGEEWKKKIFNLNIIIT